MALPQYQVTVLDSLTGAVKAIYDATLLYDLRYSRVLNGIGALAMTLPSTPDIRATFTLDTFVEVYRADLSGALQREETYLARLFHRFIEGDEERFVVGGVSLNHLLVRRVIDPADDSPGASHSAKAGRADQVIYDYCNEQAGPGASIARRTPGLSITAMPIGLPIAASLRFEYLFSQIRALAKSGAVDFQIVRTTGANLELQIGVVGTDKTYGTNAPLGQPWVGLSPQRGNLTQPSLLADRKQESNYVYALGQGQGADRILYKEAGNGVLDSPFNRIEFIQDMRNVPLSDTLALVTGAKAALKDKNFHNEFTYEPTGQEPGNIYREDWDLGDAVTAQWDETSLDLRITEVEVSISSEGETITAKVTDDFVFPGAPVEVDVDLPTRATLWHRQSTVLVGGAISASAVTTILYNHASYQSPYTDGSTFTQSCFLRAGTYTFSVLGFTGTASGMIDWYLDDVLFAAGQDWYSAVNTYNVIKTAAVTVSGDGYHVLKGVINGKNSASSNYQLAVTKFWFKQAVD